jgi:hypothetical protein
MVANLIDAGLLIKSAIFPGYILLIPGLTWCDINI